MDGGMGGCMDGYRRTKNERCMDGDRIYKRTKGRLNGSYRKVKNECNPLGFYATTLEKESVKAHALHMNQRRDE